MQVDQELATGEFFLRESVKKRKKMEEIKVRIYGGFVSFGFLQAAFEFQCSNQALCNVAFVNVLPLCRWNRPPHWPRSKKSGTKPSFLLKRSLWWRRLLKVEILKQALISEPSSDKLKEKSGCLSTWYSFALNLSILVSSMYPQLLQKASWTSKP